MKEIVRPKSLHLQAYTILKESIIAGDRKPAERIVEAKVASALGISRGPVREAIRMLIQDGLLHYNNGFVKVYEPDVADIRELFECRESLEVLAVSLAIDHQEKKMLTRLDKNLQHTQQAIDDKQDLTQFDQDFHTIILEGSCNKHLIRLLDMIKTKIHYMRSTMEANFYPTLLEEHQRLYETILEQDKVKATELMQSHIQKGLSNVLKTVEV
ncbi:MAG TPA: GntR family transcriptional regulator [Pseudogracilibacillus sp.]|nr:GntR family transcriptional regulator [Pseudogracilibacillus sp.]